MQRHPLGAVNINGGSRSDSIFANDLNTEQLEKLQKNRTTTKLESTAF